MFVISLSKTRLLVACFLLISCFLFDPEDRANIFSKTLVDCPETSRCVPEGKALHGHHSQNLKSYVQLLFSPCILHSWLNHRSNSLMSKYEKGLHVKLTNVSTVPVCQGTATSPLLNLLLKVCSLL
jgi:hypothetical protein